MTLLVSTKIVVPCAFFKSANSPLPYVSPVGILPSVYGMMAQERVKLPMTPTAVRFSTAMAMGKVLDGFYVSLRGKMTSISKCGGSCAVVASSSTMTPHQTRCTIFRSGMDLYALKGLWSWGLVDNLSISRR